MLTHEKKLDQNVQITDRRVHARVPIRAVAYVELDDNNGGLILNVSEGGIGVQSAEMIVGDHFSRIRFRMPKSEKWIETGGKLVWLGKSRKEAGIQFLNLSDDARQQIQTWIYSAAFGQTLPVEPGRFKIVWESEESPVSTDAESHGKEAPEIASMFPSEKTMPPTKQPSVSVNESSPLDLGIAPGPVKRAVVRPVGPPAQDAKPLNSSPQRDVASASEQNPRSRVAFNYNRAAETAKDPFASIAADHAESIGTSAAVPAFHDVTPPDTSAFALREHYRGLGYNPQPFEEPSGKGWWIVSGILLVLLIVGGVLAMGPANVKSLLAQHLPSSMFSSNPAPPPPDSAMDKTTAPSAMPSSPDSSTGAPAFGNSAQPFIVNPGMKPPANQSSAKIPTEEKPAEGKSAPQAGAPAAASANPADESNPAADSQESEEDAATITRRFQMEHSDSSTRAAAPPMNENFAARQPNPASTPSYSVPASPNERSTSSYTQAPSSAANTAPIASVPTSSNTAPPGSALPTGTVAVSSHFFALRGDDPQASMARQGLAIGQLTSLRQPIYPVEAERMHAEGTVQLRITVDQLGKVENVHALSGPPILIPAAIEAVRQWRYAPTTVAGQAQESVDDVSMVFRLANAASSPR